MWRIETRLDLTPSERDVVHQLIDEVGRYEGYRPLSDHLSLDLARGGQAGYAAILAFQPDGRLVGYTQLSHGDDRWALELLVDPQSREAFASIGLEMITAALSLIRQHGGGQLRWWAFRPDHAVDQIAEEVGLQPGRQLLQMRRALPTAITSDVVTRPFEVGRDEEAWLEVNNAAFHWHPEQGGWDLATMHQREGEPWFDPRGFLLHEREGRLAAFCWTKVHADDVPPLGEIYVIAVHPDFHGLGLGKALTLAGLTNLTERGLTVGMLYVDADNTAAVALYEGLGFTIHHADRAYVGDIEGATG